MCADNGVVAEGVSQSGQEVTAVVAGFMGQQASSVGKMARRAGVDVIPVDIGINTKETLPGVRNCKVMQGTRNFLQEPAMTEEEALQALSVENNIIRECKDKGYRLDRYRTGIPYQRLHLPFAAVHFVSHLVFLDLP